MNRNRSGRRYDREFIGGDATARFTVMEKLEHQYGADALSEALEVSESGFAAYRGKQNGQRWKQDAELGVPPVRFAKLMPTTATNPTPNNNSVLPPSGTLVTEKLKE